ncbi:bifunctional phosphoribosylaminoimidazolecarboxamide formyltransferase/IMP cyclohydrolase [Fulvivirga sedimenti]|uniref:Bifunctional purine biosynthesis protein PurH n=1 Tax=Fulvivirga sedimenti TaxID=2879465 RepID=A0A9X1KWR7_9BACT|nr:bifunctional phosphoribosylaminoimidazolecarboxamide formyltransferase/IMP cyclohydrolase [Fulvivirga sedimenti]MCA6074224.1 bifunctional phosphoribosylaminoimidazolecarboxamide formyltransferase/IMP cyclohydrolase [Fulvivirga sedimenti]
MSVKKIQSALISVYHKDRLEPIIRLLEEHNVKIYSTGGTQRFIEELNVPVTAVEDMTSYPSIFGGRVKTLHPKIFGGILHRRSDEGDLRQAVEFDIPAIDMVIVDLYPFEETVASGASESEIIEKIDIGGISLIRGAAKNFRDVLIVSSRDQYAEVAEILAANEGGTTLEQRMSFATRAFRVSSHYDTAIHDYFTGGEPDQKFRISAGPSRALRYGENPHQKAAFYGPLSELFDQLNGKELSFNNLVDVDAAVSLIEEFQDTAFAIIKHTNACGVATGDSVAQAYERAFAADTVSAFGGILVTNSTVDQEAAEKMHDLFFEILIAPDYTPEALELLCGKKNRIILRQKGVLGTKKQFKSLLNGVIEQDRDLKTDAQKDLTVVTRKIPDEAQMEAMIFASKICKHTKSNAIVLARNGQMLASGVGQTSRVDALKQAIAKAKVFGFDLKGSVMASDAFFPFADSVEIAHQEGITSIIQPGGSVRDKDSVEFCDKNDMAMVFTGIRHFKH